MCDNIASSGCNFIVWLCVQQRLAILDRIRKWGVTSEVTCKLCNNADESHQHLLVECSWTLELKQLILGKFGLQTEVSFVGEIMRMARVCKKKQDVAKVIHLLWLEWIYEVWITWCRLVFQGQQPSLLKARTNILFQATIDCRESMLGYLMY